MLHSLSWLYVLYVLLIKAKKTSNRPYSIINVGIYWVAGNSDLLRISAQRRKLSISFRVYICHPYSSIVRIFRMASGIPRHRNDDGELNTNTKVGGSVSYQEYLYILDPIHYTAVQSQKAVAVSLSRKQLLHLGFARQYNG